jgi:hypothetical protein
MGLRGELVVQDSAGSECEAHSAATQTLGCHRSPDASLFNLHRRGVHHAVVSSDTEVELRFFLSSFYA